MKRMFIVVLCGFLTYSCWMTNRAYHQDGTTGHIMVVIDSIPHGKNIYYITKCTKRGCSYTKKLDFTESKKIKDKQ